jgi:hypothetical protein
LFLPKYSFKTILRRDVIDRLIYDVVTRTHPDIVVKSNRQSPLCYTSTAETPGEIYLPRDPVEWAKAQGGGSFEDLLQLNGGLYRGAYNRNTLEHELSELKVSRARRRRTAYGKFMRSHRMLKGKKSEHQSIHPLIAEANASGRNVDCLRLMIYEWSSRPAQNQVFALLKQFGWHPAKPIPLYGRLASRAQARAEILFAAHLQELIGSKMQRLERKYRGATLRRRKEELLAEVAKSAGSQNLRRKYLK